MIVTIAKDGGVALHDIENFRGFHVASAWPRAERARAAEALEAAGAGLMPNGDHAWIDPAWLIRSGQALGSAWREQFDAMLAFARSKGWTDAQSGAIRGHVEWPD